MSALLAAAALLLLRAAPRAFAGVAEPVAGSMVQSREWIVHRGPRESEEFKGDVRYHAGPSVLRADWALYEHDGKLWHLKGHVRARRTLDSGDVVTAEGDKALYDGISKKGWLTGEKGVLLTRQPADGSAPDHASAQRLDWQGEEQAELSGGVHSYGPRLETWSDQARSLAAGRETIFSGGRPVVRKLFGNWTGALKADEIKTFDDPRRMSADGGVVGWIELPRKPARGTTP
ncbi:MAG: hypothetical protein KGL04_10835 [Elusimicrobia bacterium]|nr:hypothetical protein [Elusimicrobiota bacterium]MDE2314654.1 hypothetical protein [Elusimicrobiota bacterium]